MSPRAVLVCHPDPSLSGGAVFTFWADVDEARQAEAELCRPCGPQCIGHTVARLHVEREPRRRPSTGTRPTKTASAVAADGPDA